METRLRLLVVLAGLPEPVVNHVLRDENGGWTYRFDLSWPQVKLALEYDGRQHAEDSRQWVRDVRRRGTWTGAGGACSSPCQWMSSAHQAPRSTGSRSPCGSAAWSSGPATAGASTSPAAAEPAYGATPPVTVITGGWRDAAQGSLQVTVITRRGC